MKTSLIIVIVCALASVALAQPRFGAERLEGAEFKYEEPMEVASWNPPPRYSAPPGFWKPPQGFEKYGQAWSPPDLWGEDQTWDQPDQF